MEDHIKIVQDRFLEMYFTREAELQKCSDRELLDLLHHCGEYHPQQDYSIRVSVEVNKCAVQQILEKREKDRAVPPAQKDNRV